MSASVVGTRQALRLVAETVHFDGRVWVDKALAAEGIVRSQDLVQRCCSALAQTDSAALHPDIAVVHLGNPVVVDTPVVVAGTPGAAVAWEHSLVQSRLVPLYMVPRLRLLELVRQRERAPPLP
jgi:hypothetical protein